MGGNRVQGGYVSSPSFSFGFSTSIGKIVTGGVAWTYIPLKEIKGSPYDPSGLCSSGISQSAEVSYDGYLTRQKDGYFNTAYMEIGVDEVSGISRKVVWGAFDFSYDICHNAAPTQKKKKSIKFQRTS